MLTFKHSGDIIQIETGHKYFEFSMNYFIDRFNCLCNNITNINQEDLTVKKKWLSIMLAGLIALSAPVQASAAWQKTPDQNWQWSENEILAIGWKQIDGVWYHFDAKGNMSTGWMKDGKNWYYLKADGSMKTGWLNDSGQWYYSEKFAVPPPFSRLATRPRAGFRLRCGAAALFREAVKARCSWVQADPSPFSDRSTFRVDRRDRRRRGST